jgi:hypothetical protein
MTDAYMPLDCARDIRLFVDKYTIEWSKTMSEVLQSRTESNGGNDWIRTGDLYNVNVAL